MLRLGCLVVIIVGTKVAGLTLCPVVNGIESDPVRLVVGLSLTGDQVRIE